MSPSASLRRTKRRLCVVALLFALTGLLLTSAGFSYAQQRPVYPATSKHPAPAWFVDVAKQAGLTAVNINGSPDAKHYIIESTGSGVAILDYDRDGWPDILLVNGRRLP